MIKKEEKDETNNQEIENDENKKKKRRYVVDEGVEIFHPISSLFSNKEDHEMDYEMIKLTNDDINYLSHFIHPLYLPSPDHNNSSSSISILDQLSDKFCETSTLHLKSFLKDELVNDMKKLLFKEKKKDEKEGEMVDGENDNWRWDEIGPPHKQHYLSLSQATITSNINSIPSSTNTNSSFPLSTTTSSSISLSSTTSTISSLSSNYNNKEIDQQNNQKSENKEQEEEKEENSIILPSSSSFSSIEEFLLFLKVHLFSSSSFFKFLSLVTSCSFLSKTETKIRQFRRNYDYTIAYHHTLLSSSSSQPSSHSSHNQPSPPSSQPSLNPYLKINLCFVRDEMVDERDETDEMVDERDEMVDETDEMVDERDEMVNGRNNENQKNEKKVVDETDETDYMVDETDEMVNDERDEMVSWDDGDVGGYDCFMISEKQETKETDKMVDGEMKNEDEMLLDEMRNGEVFHDNNQNQNNKEEDQIINIPPSFNSLSLLLCHQNILNFIKFVSGRAPSDRWDIDMKCEVNQEEEDEDEEG